MIGKINSILFIIISCVLLTACQGPLSKKSSTYKILSKDDPKNLHYKGHYKVGQKYSIKNKTYHPKEVSRYNKIGIASWYGERYGFMVKKQLMVISIIKIY